MLYLVKEWRLLEWGTIPVVPEAVCNTSVDDAVGRPHAGHQKVGASIELGANVEGIHLACDVIAVFLGVGLDRDINFRLDTEEGNASSVVLETAGPGKRGATKENDVLLGDDISKDVLGQEIKGSGSRDSTNGSARLEVWLDGVEDGLVCESRDDDQDDVSFWDDILRLVRNTVGLALEGLLLGLNGHTGTLGVGLHAITEALGLVFEGEEKVDLGALASVHASGNVGGISTSTHSDGNSRHV